MIIYQDEAHVLHADYYDSEGHVIRYVGVTVGSNAVVFTSEPASSSPRFRLSYHFSGDGILTGTFEIAAPNQPNSFTPYLSWSARKEAVT